MVWIEMASYVLENGLTLHNSEVILIVVDKNWNATIWSVLREPGLLLDILANAGRNQYMIKLLSYDVEMPVAWVVCRILT